MTNHTFSPDDTDGTDPEHEIIGTSSRTVDIPPDRVTRHGDGHISLEFSPFTFETQVDLDEIKRNFEDPGVDRVWVNVPLENPTGGEVKSTARFDAEEVFDEL